MTVPMSIRLLVRDGQAEHVEGQAVRSFETQSNVFFLSGYSFCLHWGCGMQNVGFVCWEAPAI